MDKKYIDLNIQITEEILEEYYSKMHVLKQKPSIVFFMIMLLGILSFCIKKEFDLGFMAIAGFGLGYFLLLLSIQENGKKISKELLTITDNEYKCVITEENIKIIFKDEDIKNKIEYKNIYVVKESKNILIILYNLNTRVLLIPKNSLKGEELEIIKQILLISVDKDKLKFDKKN